MDGSVKLILITLVTLSFHSNEKFSYAIDTINATQSITHNTTLVSSGGGFELGFFSPGNSNNWYVGIWYKVSMKTVIWVANRGIPLKSRSSGVLKVVLPGRLIVLNDTDDVIWSSNASRAAQNPVVQLLDSGNLVLRDADDDRAQNVLWQSFDHPTDTVLPGMCLGLNSVYLTSWKSNEDPAPGDFVFRLDQAGYPQLITEKAGLDAYRMGPWNGLFFSGTPKVRNDSRFTFGLYKNVEGVFCLREDTIDKSYISRVTLNPSGVTQRWSWVNRTQEWVLELNIPADNCDAYNSCGAYGCCTIGNFPACACLEKFTPKDPKGWAEGGWTSNGCVRRTPLNCSAGDGFLKYSNVKLPDARNYSWHNESMNLEECRVECLRKCSCMAYTTLNISGRGSGCIIWLEDLVDIKVLSVDGQNLYVRMASSEIHSNGKELIVSLAAVGAFLVGLSVLLCLWKRKKNGNGRHAGTQNKDLELPFFDLSTISKATHGFSIQNKLGEGGYGPVYKVMHTDHIVPSAICGFLNVMKKINGTPSELPETALAVTQETHKENKGTLEDGQDIAIKRLSEASKQGLDEFKNEVIFIAKLQHRNLVKLLGCCIQGEEKMLIYEYMPDKSLDRVLFDGTNKMSLDWSKRSQIVNGIARGLMYLHQDSRLRIIHRDLKASNILLDDEMNPKISDFGIAKRCRGNETEDKTSRVVGTYGYMSPEYAVHGRFSIKSDVFSFGVVVLEIVSGKQNSSYTHGDRHLNLLGHAWTLHREGRSIELADSNLHKLDDPGEVVRLIHVGLLCVQQHPDDRPTMTTVVSVLTNDSELPQANQPAFFTETDVLSNASNNPASSKNEITITMLAGR